MFDTLPIQIADRFLGLIIGLCRGIVLAIATFLRGIITAVFTFLFVMYLSCHEWFHEGLDSRNNANFSSVAARLFLPLITPLVGVVAMAFIIVRGLFMAAKTLLVSIHQGFVKGAYDTLGEIQSDFDQIATLSVDMVDRELVMMGFIPQLYLIQNESQDLIKELKSMLQELTDANFRHVIPCEAYRILLQGELDIMEKIFAQQDVQIKQYSNTLSLEDYQIVKEFEDFQALMNHHVECVLKAWKSLKKTAQNAVENPSLNDLSSLQDSNTLTNIKFREWAVNTLAMYLSDDYNPTRAILFNEVGTSAKFNERVNQVSDKLGLVKMKQSSRVYEAIKEMKLQPKQVENIKTDVSNNHYDPTIDECGSIQRF